MPSAFDSHPGAGDASVYFDSMWRWYEKEGGFADIAAYLATLDLSHFNPKTPAFWAIVDANRPAEEAEIMDALDTLNNPPAITIEGLMTGATGDLAAFLLERRNRRAYHTGLSPLAMRSFEMTRPRTGYGLSTAPER
jgi:hypothetical protein